MYSTVNHAHVCMLLSLHGKGQPLVRMEGPQVMWHFSHVSAVELEVPNVSTLT